MQKQIYFNLFTEKKLIFGLFSASGFGHGRLGHPQSLEYSSHTSNSILGPKIFSTLAYSGIYVPALAKQNTKFDLNPGLVDSPLQVKSKSNEIFALRIKSVFLVESTFCEFDEYNNWILPTFQVTFKGNSASKECFFCLLSPISLNMHK